MYRQDRMKKWFCLVAIAREISGPASLLIMQWGWERVWEFKSNIELRVVPCRASMVNLAWGRDNIVTWRVNWSHWWEWQITAIYFYTVNVIYCFCVRHIPTLSYRIQSYEDDSHFSVRITLCFYISQQSLALKNILYSLCTTIYYIFSIIHLLYILSKDSFMENC